MGVEFQRFDDGVKRTGCAGHTVITSRHEVAWPAVRKARKTPLRPHGRSPDASWPFSAALPPLPITALRSDRLSLVWQSMERR